MTLKDQIPMTLRAAYMALHRRSNACFAKFGFTADQFVLLATLARGKALTQRELARRMPSDPSTVRAMLVTLEKQGVVRRDAHPTDSRARTVSLTAAGMRKFRQLWSAGEPIRVQIFRALQPGEAEALIGFLRHVTEALSAESALAGDSNSREGRINAPTNSDAHVNGSVVNLNGARNGKIVRKHVALASRGI